MNQPEIQAILTLRLLAAFVDGDKYLPAMQDEARTLDAGKVLAMVRGA